MFTQEHRAGIAVALCLRSIVAVHEKSGSFHPSKARHCHLPLVSPLPQGSASLGFTQGSPLPPF